MAKGALTQKKARPSPASVPRLRIPTRGPDTTSGTIPSETQCFPHAFSRLKKEIRLFGPTDFQLLLLLDDGLMRRGCWFWAWLGSSARARQPRRFGSGTTVSSRLKLKMGPILGIDPKDFRSLGDGQTGWILKARGGGVPTSQQNRSHSISDQKVRTDNRRLLAQHEQTVLPRWRRCQGNAASCRRANCSALPFVDVSQRLVQEATVPGRTGSSGSGRNE